MIQDIFISFMDICFTSGGLFAELNSEELPSPPPPPLLFKRPKNVATLGSCFLLVLVEVFLNPLTLKTDQHLLSPENKVKH